MARTQAVLYWLPDLSDSCIPTVAGKKTKNRELAPPPPPPSAAISWGLAPSAGASLMSRRNSAWLLLISCNSCGWFLPSSCSQMG